MIAEVSALSSPVWRVLAAWPALWVMRRRSFWPAAAIALLFASPIWAVPLDVQNGSARSVLLEFEISSNPSVVGQSYTPPYPASYSASGGVGTVTLAGSEYEAYLVDYGGSWLGDPWPGTFTDYTIEVDLTTLEATGWASGEVGWPASMTTSVSTTGSGGYGFNPTPPPEGPLFCTTPSEICTLVPTAAYDPETGTLNAVGYDRLSHHMSLDWFSFSGDLRLSEAEEPVPALGGWGALSLGSLLLLAACRRAAAGRAQRLVWRSRGSLGAKPGRESWEYAKDSRRTRRR